MLFCLIRLYLCIQQLTQSQNECLMWNDDLAVLFTNGGLLLSKV